MNHATGITAGLAIDYPVIRDIEFLTKSLDGMSAMDKRRKKQGKDEKLFFPARVASRAPKGLKHLTITQIRHGVISLWVMVVTASKAEIGRKTVPSCLAQGGPSS